MNCSKTIKNFISNKHRIGNKSLRAKEQSTCRYIYILKTKSKWLIPFSQ